MQVLKRHAVKLKREQGYGDYQLIEYTEGIDSKTLGAQRVAEGTIKLVQRQAADSFQPVSYTQLDVYKRQAKSQLGLVESNLDGVTGELGSVIDRAIQAGNGTLGAAERRMIAAELQSRLDNLVGLSNEQDGTGQYLYSGFQSQVLPFAVTGNVAVGAPPVFDLTNQHVSFAGDDGIRRLQVSSSVDIAINAGGNDVFMRVRDAAGNLTGRSMFDSVKNLINNLQQPTFDSSTYGDSLSELRSSLDNVSRVRSAVGANLNALDGLDNSSQDLKLQYEQRLSDLQDVDLSLIHI